MVVVVSCLDVVLLWLAVLLGIGGPSHSFIIASLHALVACASLIIAFNVSLAVMLLWLSSLLQIGGPSHSFIIASFCAAVACASLIILVSVGVVAFPVVVGGVVGV